MSFSQQIDATEALPVRLPYIAKGNLFVPHLRPGSMNLSNRSGRFISKRPGIENLSGWDDFPAGLTPIWGLEYDNEQGEVRMAVSAQAVDGSHQLYIGSPDESWTIVSNLRDIDQSEFEHEMAVLGGRLYVRGVPPAEKNAILHSADFTDAAWIKTDATAVGTTLSDTSASGAGTVGQGFTLADEEVGQGLYMTFALWVQKDTDQTRMLAIEVETQTIGFATLGTTIGQVNTETGESGPNATALDAGSAWLVWVSRRLETSAAKVVVRIYPSYSTTLGGAADLTLVGSIDVDKAQLRIGWSPRPGVYAATTTAKVSGDRLGGVIADWRGSLLEVQPWGLVRPTAAPTFTSSGGWSASTNPVTANIGVRYAYAYISSSGHQSSRSPATPISTAFTNLQPTINLEGLADTTAVPSIAVFRSGDGGGTLWRVTVIANPGAGSFTYSDDTWQAGSVDPNESLSFINPAPSEVSNDPPPPFETGTIGLNIVERSGPLAVFNGRIYIPVGFQVYFSSVDESFDPNARLEESYPSGETGSANRISFSKQPIELRETRQGLYCFTRSDGFLISGTSRYEIQADQVLEGLGALNRRCSVSRGSSIYWADQRADIQALSQFNSPPQLISGALGSDLASATELQLYFYTQDETQLLMVRSGLNYYTFTSSDPEPLWNPVWAFTNVVPAEFVSNLHFIHTDGSIGVLDQDIVGDFGADVQALIVLSPARTSSGNHVNTIRLGGHVGAGYYVRLLTVGTAPTVRAAVQTLTKPVSGLTAVQMNLQKTPVGWGDKAYFISEAGEWVSLWIDSALDAEVFELHGFQIVFEPEIVE